MAFNLKEDLHSIKSKLFDIESELKRKVEESESKLQKFLNVDKKSEEIKLKKDRIITLNVGGKIFQTKLSNLLSFKDTLFYRYFSKFFELNEDIPTELFFDRSFVHFSLILDFLRTKKFSMKPYNRYEKEDIKTELEYYGLDDILGISKKEQYDLCWDAGRSKAGTFTIAEDPKQIRIHSTTCYTHFVTNIDWKEENFLVELEVAVTQSDSYLYVGLVNQTYSLTGNCMCCNPANAWYVQCNGTIHSNTQNTNNTMFSWGSSKIVIVMRVMLSEKQIYFSVQDKEEAGPFMLVGESFRVVAGHCNSGNGTINILNCESII